MKVWRLLFIGGPLLGLAIPMAQAGNESPVPAVPQGYDLSDLKAAPSQAAPRLEPLDVPGGSVPDEAVVSASGEGANSRIDWSGQVSTSVVYKNTKQKY